jgi:hypothetical protein
LAFFRTLLFGWKDEDNEINSLWGSSKTKPDEACHEELKPLTLVFLVACSESIL